MPTEEQLDDVLQAFYCHMAGEVLSSAVNHVLEAHGLLRLVGDMAELREDMRSYATEIANALDPVITVMGEGAKQRADAIDKKLDEASK